MDDVLVESDPGEPIEISTVKNQPITEIDSQKVEKTKAELKVLKAFLKTMQIKKKSTPKGE